MFFKNKRRSIMGMNMNMHHHDSFMSTVKMLAAGALIYQTARYMMHEMIDE